MQYWKQRFVMDLQTALAVVGASRVVESAHMVVQFRTPRSRRRRIREKWAAEPTNFRPYDKIYCCGGVYMCHPVIAKELRRHLPADKYRGLAGMFGK